MFFFRLLLLCWLSLHEIFFFADAWINRSGLLIPCIISPETSRDVVIPSLTSDRESKSHHGWWTIQHDVCLTLVLHKSSLWKKKETSFRFEHQNQVLTFLVFLKLSWYLLFFVESSSSHFENTFLLRKTILTMIVIIIMISGLSWAIHSCLKIVGDSSSLFVLVVKLFWSSSPLMNRFICVVSLKATSAASLILSWKRETQYRRLLTRKKCS